MLTLTFADGTARRSTLASRQVNVWYNESGVCCARAFVDGPIRRIEWIGLGSFEFQPDCFDVRVTPQVEVRPDVVVDTFERLVQPVILQSLGLPVLHASAVRLPFGVVGFCARSGSGKSTFAAGLQRRGHEQFADDALVLRLSASSVTAHALPFISRLRAASADYFSRTTTEPAPHLRAAPGTTSPLAALFLVSRQSDPEAPTMVERVSALQAFSAVLTHAHCFDTDDKPAVARLVSDYLDLTHAVPVFECRYQPGWDHFPEVLDRIVKTAGGLA
jgi:hypothetical protein